MPKMRL